MIRRSLGMLAVLGCASTAGAQTANPLATEAKQAYTNAKNNLVRMAEKMPDEHYAFKPVPEIRTFGELVAHVADSQARTCSAVAGEAKAVDAASKTTKADLVAALKASYAICDPVFDALTDATAGELVKLPRGQRTRLGALAGMTTHSALEYGYMAVYLRLKGVVPPTSEGR
jgi:uncharacterized damage-inducible protein DinB